MIYTVEFADQQLEIECHGFMAEKIAAFLFPDAADERIGEYDPLFSLKTLGQDGKLQYLFEKGGREIFRSHDTGAMAAMVLDAVVSWFAGECHVGPTLHAAALLMDDHRGILLPGKSGSGKSTLSALLAHYGQGYLTDELTCIENKTPQTVAGFSRPIHLKEPMAEYFSQFLTKENGKKEVDCIGSILKSNQGLLVPVKHLNPMASVQKTIKPRIATIVFPTFRTGFACDIEPISSAQSFARMMGVVVNARNFKDHATASIAQLSRDIPAFSLTFGQLGPAISVLEPFLKMNGGK